jgi:hypothetical protein
LHFKTSTLKCSTLLASSPFTQRPFALSKAKFGAAFKTTTFLFRAMQDALCRLLLSVHGQLVGNRTSIVKAMDLEKRCYASDHPLGALLAVQMPEYIDWFKIHKTRRDLIKRGIPISYHSGKDHLTGEVSFSIRIGNPAVMQSTELSLDQIADDMTITAKLTKVVIRSGIESGRLMRAL